MKKSSKNLSNRKINKTNNDKQITVEAQKRSKATFHSYVRISESFWTDGDLETHFRTFPPYPSSLTLTHTHTPKNDSPETLLENVSDTSLSRCFWTR